MPILCRCLASSPLVIHVREDGVVRGWRVDQTTFFEPLNPALVSVCGRANSEDLGDDVSRETVARLRMCDECKAALDVWFIKQELNP